MYGHRESKIIKTDENKVSFVINISSGIVIYQKYVWGKASRGKLKRKYLDSLKIDYKEIMKGTGRLETTKRREIRKSV